jgi:tetratricopeptide (TPR) repeat protein
LTCDDIERDEIAEAYVLGRLPEQASSEFESHYFECPRCLAQVELLESTRTHLLTGPHAAAGVRRFPRVIGAVAAAAVVVIAVGVIRQFSSEPVSAPAAPPASNIELPGTPPSAAPAASIDLRALGAIVPPRFDAPRLRVSPTASRRAFLQAMEFYQRGDCQQAAGGLLAAVEQDPKSIPAHFFLAICSLQLDRDAQAADHLKIVVQLGESPYFEDAHFFLAKAHIRQGDLASARKELQAVVALEGDRRAEASNLLTQIR